jgi:four helix bundle protein
MKIKKFEDIIAWQKARDLTVKIYLVFKVLRDYGFKDQVCRASVSISNNIAEGFDRSSRTDFKRFLYISLSSCSEVKSMLYLVERLKYIEIKERDLLINKPTEVSMIITGLIKSIKTDY